MTTAMRHRAPCAMRYRMLLHAVPHGTHDCTHAWHATWVYGPAVDAFFDGALCHAVVGSTVYVVCRRWIAQCVGYFRRKRHVCISNNCFYLYIIFAKKKRQVSCSPWSVSVYYRVSQFPLAQCETLRCTATVLIARCISIFAKNAVFCICGFPDAALHE